MDLPIPIIVLAESCRAAGGRAWVVGGAVRDALMGLDPKDIDVEVHGLESSDLLDVLQPLGTVNEIGKSFGVHKLTIDGLDIDVSIPRRDSHHGPAHTDVAIVGDPFMGIEAAARRRDLTINAIAYDPLSAEYADPYGGMQDLDRGRLAAVDPNTFGDDPLRALRVVQFAARFGFAVHPELMELCQKASLLSLPEERIWGEVEKLLMKAPAPSLGWSLAKNLRILDQVLPEVAPLPIEPILRALDRAASRRGGHPERGRGVALMLSALLHSATHLQAEKTLDRLGVHRHHGFPVRKRVLQGVDQWRTLASPCTDTVLRRLAEKHELLLLCETAWAARGQPASLGNLDRADRLGIGSEPVPRLVQGRDLTRLGVVPGPEMGTVLQQVREAQLDGEIADRDAALIWLKDYLDPADD